MGMYYSAAIFVGLPRKEIEHHEHFEEFEDGDLDQAPPYYDGSEAALFGVSVCASDLYHATEIFGTLDDRIESAKQEFKEKTGLDGKVYITPIGW